MTSASGSSPNADGTPRPLVVLVSREMSHQVPVRALDNGDRGSARASFCPLGHRRCFARQCLVVRSPSVLVGEDAIKDVVAERWGLRIGDLRYVPEGGGAYHWIAYAVDGRRWFVTCDDLDTKPWLGSDRDSVFDGLRAAYQTAMD